MQEKWLLATSFMEMHPGLELRLTGRKFVDFWMGTEAPVKNFRETDSWLIRAVLIVSFLTGIGALFGVVALWTGKKKIAQRHRENRGDAEGDAEKQVKIAKGNWVFPLAVFPLIFPCLYFVTHADLRYRHPIDPVVCLLTVAGVAAALELLGAKGNRGFVKGAPTG
jgi:hypothetical protein